MDLKGKGIRVNAVSQGVIAPRFMLKQMAKMAKPKRVSGVSERGDPNARTVAYHLGTGTEVDTWPKTAASNEIP